MSRLKSLAAASGPLADALIERLRASIQMAALGPPLNGEEDDQESYQLDLLLTEDRYAGGGTASVSPLRPEKAAAAVLFGQAFDQNRGVLAQLQDPDVVTVIEVPGPEFLDPIEQLLRNDVLGRDTPIVDGDECRHFDPADRQSRSVALFSRKEEQKDKAGANIAFATAARQGRPIIGLSSDPDRFLPRDLLRMSEHRIVVNSLDGSSIAAVIEAVTGRSPGPVADDIARNATLEALTIAVRADLGADRSLARLKRLLDRDSNASQGPTLSELHGLGVAKEWGLALVQDLQDYVAGRLPWSAVDRGCLITGAPGTGKTTFARSLARESGVNFVATSYGQWQAHKEGHLGHVTQAIRNAFAEARRHQPAILFIDEIDTLPARGTGQHNDDWWTSITNSLLECLDGFERREGVVVIAACNDASRLDPALVRAGRLDRHIEIPRPDLPALVGIFRAHLGTDLPAADLRPAALAGRGGTGADVERWVREARRHARKAGRDVVMQDLLDAVRSGKPELPVAVRRQVALHEAGHAVVTLTLGIAEPIALSINGDGGLSENAAGESRAHTRGHLEKHLTALLAGRAAETLVYGEPTAGAGGNAESDLGLATAFAVKIETSYGLGCLGPVWIGSDTNTRDLLLSPELYESVRRMIETAEATAIKLLSLNRRSLDALADALCASGYLDRDEIDAVLAKAPLRTTPVMEAPAVPAAKSPDCVHERAKPYSENNADPTKGVARLTEP